MMTPCISVPGERVIFNDSVLDVFLYLDAPKIPQLPTWEITLKIVFYIIAMVVDIVGNVTVILIICLNKKIRTHKSAKRPHCSYLIDKMHPHAEDGHHDIRNS
jgi:hypothetical protein